MARGPSEEPMIRILAPLLAAFILSVPAACFSDGGRRAATPTEEDTDDAVASQDPKPVETSVSDKPTAPIEANGGPASTALEDAAGDPEAAGATMDNNLQKKDVTEAGDQETLQKSTTTASGELADKSRKKDPANKKEEIETKETKSDKPGFFSKVGEVAKGIGGILGTWGGAGGIVYLLFGIMLMNPGMILVGAGVAVGAILLAAAAETWL